jgi:uncharacterized phage protein (TIGR01671 family)
MSERLRFRAWDGKRMRYDVTGLEHGKENEMAGVFLDGDYYAIKDCPVMQSTGLRDKSGKLIFEGDVLRVEGEVDRGDGYRDDSLFYVRFDERGCPVAQEIVHLDWVFLDDYDFEIVGNIHEHPELLK